MKALLASIVRGDVLGNTYAKSFYLDLLFPLLVVWKERAQLTYVQLAFGLVLHAAMLYSSSQVIVFSGVGSICSENTCQLAKGSYLLRSR